MPLLLDRDYAELNERGIAFVEDPSNRFLILKGFDLPTGIYVQAKCDVLVAIPANYNHDGIDMFWTYPRLLRANGVAIPATADPGTDSRMFEGNVFCRWSRHWNGSSVMWRPGKDNVVTIVRRVTWALEHPDTQ